MPIPILQYGVKVRDPTTKQFKDLSALRGGQGAQGQQGVAGPGVPAGGTDGDVLVKSGSADYAGTWTNTPKLMGNLAPIEESQITSPTGYNPGDYLVYNGQLYYVKTLISPQDPLDAGANGNIEAVSATTAAKNESIDAVRVIDYDISNLTIGANGYVAVGSYKPSTPAGYGVLLFIVRNATYSGNYAFPVIDGNGNFMYGSPNFTYKTLNCRAIYKRV